MKTPKLTPAIAREIVRDLTRAQIVERMMLLDGSPKDAECRIMGNALIAELSAR